MPPSMTVDELEVPISAKESLVNSQLPRSDEKKASWTPEIFPALPNANAYPSANGASTTTESTMATAAAAADGVIRSPRSPTRSTGNATPPKTRSSGATSGSHADDMLRSRTGSAISTAQDEPESGRRSSRPSSASTRPALGLNGLPSTTAVMANGGPVLPSQQSPPDGPRQAPTVARNMEPKQPLADALPVARHLPSTSYPPVHRLSSPPLFGTPSSTPAAGSTPSSPFQSGPPPPLKHRHTLEVPKVSMSRTSRDHPSTAHNTNKVEDGLPLPGRFSFAAANPRRGSLALGRQNTRSLHSDLHLEEVLQDDDAARWTEAIRQKRTSRRKRREEDDDGRVVMGTKVDQHHVNWVTAYNMLTGIRFTVSRTNAKLDRELTDADFHARHKFSFDITGNELTPSAKYDFKFKDYAPWVFRHLRSSFKLDPGDYLMSLTSKYILSELGSPGKSGSFFYFSRDYKYIIKTIHHGEHKRLRMILRDYYEHVQRNPNTLLSQFYGLHRVKIPYGKKIHFVVMNNLFPPHRDIHQTFDLKGSTIGRDFKEEELDKNPRATLKDLNWLRRGMHLEFGPRKRDVFLRQVERDVELLQRLRIMDYSLLIGIHDLERGNDEGLRDKTLQVFHPGGAEREEEEQQQQQQQQQQQMLQRQQSDIAIEQSITRTPSSLENARKARELRQIIKKEKPIPMDQTTSRMPDEMLEERKDLIFYSDDGGFRATHVDNRPGEDIYYLGIIDCLTHYGTIKKMEHFIKGLSHPKSQISPIAPEGYGERFVRFITGITKSSEEAELEKKEKEMRDAMTMGVDGPASGPRPSSLDQSQAATQRVMEKAERQARKTERDGAVETDAHDRIIAAVRSPASTAGIPSGGASGSAKAVSGGEQDGSAGQLPGGHTLPIVDEVGEGGSTSGRSGRSRDEDGERDKREANVGLGSGGGGGASSSDCRPPGISTTTNGHAPSLQALLSPSTAATAAQPASSSSTERQIPGASATSHPPAHLVPSSFIHRSSISSSSPPISSTTPAPAPASGPAPSARQFQASYPSPSSSAVPAPTTAASLSSSPPAAGPGPSPAPAPGSVVAPGPAPPKIVSVSERAPEDLQVSVARVSSS